jgi:hypothetical protein
VPAERVSKIEASLCSCRLPWQKGGAQMHSLFSAGATLLIVLVLMKPYSGGISLHLRSGEGRGGGGQMTKICMNLAGRTLRFVS